ncbi:F-box protein CPR30-like [Pyrus ussuriensis x Pyrus communis]|uniref:F-box protein CPR30-like n=1 Tax=Pyrus ussuriensis x Pyrus communis TaxID=2448454 RepID=A0A5N5HBX3_9ROSA|nr:F-box protein CPR30-like [Pyrus ussuriensis x Pyrus communis]
MSSFPPELVVDILSWLAPDDLIPCMRVCKAWNAFIRGQNFIKSHLQRSIQTNSTRAILLTSSDSVLFSMPFGGNETFGSAVKIVPALKDTWILRLGWSVNGLFCILNKGNGGFALWNPLIRKLKEIPRSTLESLPPLVSGVLPCMDLGMIPLMLIINFGALCWLMHNNTNRLIILYLDLASEKYRQFPTPYVGSGRTYLLLHWSGRHDVWIMKEYGVAESWTFLFSVEMEVLPMGFDLLCKPLVFSENGDIVLLTNDNGDIYWYDFEKKSSKRVEIHGEPSTYTATVCVGSLCLLDGDSVVAERQ